MKRLSSKGDSQNMFVEHRGQKQPKNAIFAQALRTDGPTEGQTDGRTEGPTDRPSYRDARTHLKSGDTDGQRRNFKVTTRNLM